MHSYLSLPLVENLVKYFTPGEWCRRCLSYRKSSQISRRQERISVEQRQILEEVSFKAGSCGAKTESWNGICGSDQQRGSFFICFDRVPSGVSKNLWIKGTKTRRDFAFCSRPILRTMMFLPWRLSNHVKVFSFKFVLSYLKLN